MVASASEGAGALVGGRFFGGTACGVAAGLVLTARAALEIGVDELAGAAGCGVDLVDDIETGRCDPVLDTVERLVNSVGLEVRAGAGDGSGGVLAAMFESEVRRVRQAFVEAVEFRGFCGLGPPGPLKGTQWDWDGVEPAPPRLFGAGPTRRDGGGWAAILVSGQRQRSGAALEDIAAAASVSPARVAGIEAGRIRPPTSELERLLSAMGAGLRARLEPYDDHDDGLHLQAVADPERYRRRLSNGEAAFSAAVVLD